MLMICHKTRATNGEGFIDQRNEHLVSNLTSQLRNGLQKVVGALDNYSMSFEALSGMRGQYHSHITQKSLVCSPSWQLIDDLPRSSTGGNRRRVVQRIMKISIFLLPLDPDIGVFLHSWTLY